MDMKKLIHSASKSIKKKSCSNTLLCILFFYVILNLMQFFLQDEKKGNSLYRRLKYSAFGA